MRLAYGLGVGVVVLATFAIILIAGNSVKAAESVGDVYTLSTCPISGKPLGPGAVAKLIEGRDVRFCCDGCPGKFEAEKEKYVAKINAAIIEQQKERYPLKTCVVGGHELGDTTVDYVYNNRLVRFCCPDCQASFDKDPKQYLSKIDAAVIEAQEKTYPLTTCVVSDEALNSMGEPVKHVVANRLVQFCCKNCVKKFSEQPLDYLSKLDKQ